MRNKLIILLILPLFLACEVRRDSSSDNDSDGVKQLSQSIKRDDAETVKTYISMKAGQLNVMGGAKNLVDTEITSKEDWQPDIEYTTTGKTGRLRIEQPDINGINFNISDDGDANRWLIQLNDQVPQDLHLTIGAGETNIDLQGLMLNSVNMDAGVGEHSLNLANTSLPELEINAGVGEVSIDLTGQWKNDLEADINGGIGELNLILPHDIGIRVEVNGALGSVNAPDLNKDGRVFTNELYGQSDFVLNFEVKAGIGSVNISLD